MIRRLALALAVVAVLVFAGGVTYLWWSSPPVVLQSCGGVWHDGKCVGLPSSECPLGPTPTDAYCYQTYP
jgi:hypothetical protein